LDCFTCAVGDHKIGEGVNFHVYEDKVYCPQHFEELFLQRCAGCSQIIKGQYVKVLDAHFHPQCWKCSDCGVIISSDNCGQSGGKFYCRSCVTKRGGAAPSGAAATRAVAAIDKAKQAREEKSASGGGGGGGGGGGFGGARSSGGGGNAGGGNAGGGNAGGGSAGGGGGGFVPPSAPVERSAAPAGGGGPYYSFDVLKSAECPPDVDKDLKEKWLADDVFQKLFQMDKPTFSALPAWKKKRLKQKVGLF